MQVGRKIFFDKATGNILIDTGEMQGDIVEQTVEQLIPLYTALSERNRSTFDVLELPFGAFEQDFAECNGYRVNVETKTLEFSYPDPNDPTAEPVFAEPLSEQIKKVEAQTKQLNDDFLALSEYVTTL